jgi:hypothetical protein
LSATVPFSLPPVCGAGFSVPHCLQLTWPSPTKNAGLGLPVHGGIQAALASGFQTRLIDGKLPSEVANGARATRKVSAIDGDDYRDQCHDGGLCGSRLHRLPGVCVRRLRVRILGHVRSGRVLARRQQRRQRRLMYCCVSRQLSISTRHGNSYRASRAGRAVRAHPQSDSCAPQRNRQRRRAAARRRSRDLSSRFHCARGVIATRCDLRRPDPRRHRPRYGGVPVRPTCQFSSPAYGLAASPVFRACLHAATVD